MLNSPPYVWLSTARTPNSNSQQNQTTTHLESGGAVGDESRADLADTMGEGELEAWDHQLLDVWAANVLGLLDLNNTENL